MCNYFIGCLKTDIQIDDFMKSSCKITLLNSIDIIHVCVNIKTLRIMYCLVLTLMLNYLSGPGNSSTQYSLSRRDRHFDYGRYKCMTMVEFRVNFKLGFVPNSLIEYDYLLRAMACGWQTIIPTIVKQDPWRHMGLLGLNVLHAPAM